MIQSRALIRDHFYTYIEGLPHDEARQAGETRWKEYWKHYDAAQKLKCNIPVTPNHNLEAMPMHFAVCDTPDVRTYCVDTPFLDKICKLKDERCRYAELFTSVFECF